MRVIRFLLWFIAVIALLAMSYVVAIYFLVNANSVSERIANELDRNFGYKISMHAAPEVRVLPTIEVQLPAATITDKNGQTVAFYRSAYLEINPIWLVLGQTHIEKLHLDGASAQIVAPNTWPAFIEGLKSDKVAIFDDIVIKNLSINQGELSINRKGKKLAFRNIALSVNEPAPQMHGSIKVSAQIADTDKGLLFDGSAALMLDLDLNQGIIGIENLQLQAQGTRGATPLSLTLTANLAKLQAQNAYVSSGEARLITNDGNDQFALSMADLQLDTTQWQAPDFHVYFAQGSGQQRLELDLRSPVTAQWDAKTWQAAHIQGSLLLPGTGNASPLSGQASIDWLNEKADFELFARLHNAPMSFKGKAEGFAHPQIKGQLTFGRLDLLELQKLSILQNVHLGHTFNDHEASSANTQEDVASASEGAVSDAGIGEAQTQTETISESAPEEKTEEITHEAPIVDSQTNDVQSQEAAKPQVAEPVASPVVWIDTNEGRFVKTQSVDEATTQTVDDQTPPLESDTVTKPFDFSVLNGFDFQGDIIIGELVYGNARLLQVKGPISVKSGTLQMPKLTGLAYESHFNAFASVNAQGHWNTQFKATNANLDGLLKDLGATASMGGKLNTQINLYGDDFSLDTLNGQIGFAVQQSSLYGLNINDALRAIEKGQIPVQTPQSKSSVAKIQGIATLHAAKVNIENLAVAFDEFALKGNVQIDLKNQNLTGNIKGNTNRGLAVQVALTGVWYQPQLSLDANAIMRANGITPKPVVIDKPKEKKPSGWDRFKNFIKDRL